MDSLWNAVGSGIGRLYDVLSNATDLIFQLYGALKALLHAFGL